MNIWDKLTRVVIILLVVAGLLGVGIGYLPVIRQNQRMRTESQRLEGQVQKEEESSKQLKTSIDALLEDPKTVERAAREKLGYAKPGETVVRFEQPITNAPARP